MSNFEFTSVSKPEVFSTLYELLHHTDQSAVIAREDANTDYALPGFEDLTGYQGNLGYTIGTGCLYSTPGVTWQLMMSLGLGAHEKVEDILAQTEELAEAIAHLRRIQALGGFRVMDLGCGGGHFALAARSLGAEVHTADGDPDIRPREYAAAHTTVDFNYPDAGSMIAETSGVDFDLVTSSYVYAAGCRIKVPEPERMFAIAGLLARDKGFFQYKEVELYQKTTAS